jgi:hypothetical protein
MKGALFYYVHMQVKQNNFIVLINPFYRNIDYAKQVPCDRIVVITMCSGMKKKGACNC